MRGILIFALLLAAAAKADAACGIGDLGVAQVAGVRDDATLVLADGRELRLAAIEPGPRARSILLGFKGELLRLSAPAEPQTDRYGRLVAFAAADERSLQETLVSLGAARVSARAGIACAEALQNLEAAAREARHGLWSDPNFALLQAEPGPWMQTELGRFVLVEGRVLSVRQSGGTIYVNFGRRWTRDFSATIPRRLQAGFRAAGRDPQSFMGRRIRVRGWLERRTGPIIELTAPEQVELLE
jgi:hypothetical protein